MYVWLNGVPTWRRYRLYARSTATSRHERPASSTSRLKPSSSASPLEHREERLLEDASDAPVRRIASGTRSRKCLIQRGSSPAGVIVYGRSSSTIDAHVGEARQHLGERRLRAERRRA